MARMLMYVPFGVLKTFFEKKCRELGIDAESLYINGEIHSSTFMNVICCDPLNTLTSTALEVDESLIVGREKELTYPILPTKKLDGSDIKIFFGPTIYNVINPFLHTSERDSPTIIREIKRQNKMIDTYVWGVRLLLLRKKEMVKAYVAFKKAGDIVSEMELYRELSEKCPDPVKSTGLEIMYNLFYNEYLNNKEEYDLAHSFIKELNSSTRLS